MKRIFTTALLALSSLAALAATTVPPQLISPTGSTAGQAIVSNGPSSVPTWGNVTAAALSPVAANTVIANPTGSTAAPTAFAMPSCSTSTSAIQYTSGTGFTCFTGSAPLASPAFTGTATFATRPTFAGNTPWDSGNLPNPASTTGNLGQFASTTSAQLATVISNETGSGALVFGTSPTIDSPTINTPTINGVTNASDAPVGAVGEYRTAFAASVALTTGTPTNITSISLPAGDWNVGGSAFMAGAGGASMTTVIAGLSTTSATLGSVTTYFQITTAGLGSNGSYGSALPITRVSVSGTTTVYCVAQVAFSSGTASGNCGIWARRIR